MSSTEPQQDDLTADDHLIENTDKVPYDVDGEGAVSQDPTWVPEGSL